MNTNPKKQKAVFARIYDEITRGCYPPGSLLPNEIELAAKYQVARKTLRGALTMLEEQQLIVRRRPQGTLVCNRLGAPADGQVISLPIRNEDTNNIYLQLSGWNDMGYELFDAIFRALTKGSFFSIF